jgi:paraquat-inducible protein B
MNPAPVPSRDTLPRAKTRRRRWSIPLIWVVPLGAALVAAWLVYQRARESGPKITIRFRDGEGLNPGQTPIRYRGADVGQVSAVALSEDHRYATVEARLHRSGAFVACQGSVFWIVRPQLGAGNFTGLGTLITGPYITVLPGEGSRAADFVGVDDSPLVLDPHGLRIVLLSSHGGSLQAGVPIYYRGIEVGAVRETRLSTNATTVEIHSVIRRPYAPLVRAESKFWNVTGLDVRVGLFRGAEIDVESLKSLLIGGIAFATPEDSKDEPVHDGMVFRLYDREEKKWLEWAPPIAIPPGERETTRVKREAAYELPLP